MFNLKSVLWSALYSIPPPPPRADRASPRHEEGRWRHFAPPLCQPGGGRALNHAKKMRRFNNIIAESTRCKRGFGKIDISAGTQIKS